MGGFESPIGYSLGLFLLYMFMVIFDGGCLKWRANASPFSLKKTKKCGGVSLHYY
jgi:hypothetical protein